MSIKFRKLVAVFASVCMVASFAVPFASASATPPAAPSAANDIVVIPESDFADPNFYQGMLDVADTDGDGAISEQEAADVARIELHDKGISNITGIENFPNTQRLDLSINDITDPSPIASLSALTFLSLSDNELTDVSSLAPLTGLKSLGLAYNHIEDISALAGMTNLSAISLDANKLSDISALAGMTKLKNLDATGMRISDISALAGNPTLAWVYMDGNSLNMADPATVQIINDLKFNNKTYFEIGYQGPKDGDKYNAAQVPVVIYDQLNTIDLDGMVYNKATAVSTSEDGSHVITTGLGRVVNFSIDTQGPAITAKLEGTGIKVSDNAYTQKNVVVTIDGASSVKINGEDATLTDGTITLTEEGFYTIEATDESDNVSYFQLTIDRTAPVFAQGGPGTGLSMDGGFTKYDIKTMVSEENGPVSIYVNGDFMLSSVNPTLTFTEPGTYVVEARDLANNVARYTATIDRTPPTLSGAEENVTYTTDVTLTASEEVRFFVNGVEDPEYKTSMTFSEDGRYVVRVYDRANNRTGNLTFWIKKTAPTLTVKNAGTGAVLEKAEDGKYYCNQFVNVAASEKSTFYVNGVSKGLLYTLGIRENGEFTVYSEDSAGNRSEEITIVIDRNRVTISGVRAGSVNVKDVNLTFNKSVNVTVERNLNGTITTDTVKNVSNLTLTENGNYKITAADAGGNSATISFTIAKAAR